MPDAGYLDLKFTGAGYLVLSDNSGIFAGYPAGYPTNLDIQPDIKQNFNWKVCSYERKSFLFF